MGTAVYSAAKVIWDYHLLSQQPETADVILVMGSNDLRVAEHAAALYKQGLAPLVVFSGAQGRFTSDLFDCTEAEAFSQVAMEKGVPATAVALEKEATNTGENVQFSRALLEKHGKAPRRVLVVQKPYMERRAYATVKKQWPGVEVTVASPPISLVDYPTDSFPFADVVSAMLDDFDRVRDYPEKGFQISQDIPEEVHQAAATLRELGF
ncbi:YdcF family protein [Thaumasiovibrio subtropicus]|uniref:YdcF family protein n=1 Tax=Thaumasiovibrio subtropicus TaxID=1891207 RepID=UPI000B34E5A5|nr:YdcF family protein [Thaumasiovibrio subtropicus]